MTQEELILVYMKDHGGITSAEAFLHCGCLRLPARVADLKDKGYDIKDIWCYKTDSNGKIVKKWKKFYL